jgi:hypothetical protein
MKTQLTATVAATIVFLLNSAPSTAAEPQFQAPATERAQQSAQLPTQTTHWAAAIGTGHVLASSGWAGGAAHYRFRADCTGRPPTHLPPAGLLRMRGR